tara:strand:- start:3 stop:215 length:213 start_codon:yes stop_codon:yes gene_type:complete
MLIRIPLIPQLNEPDEMLVNPDKVIMITEEYMDSNDGMVLVRIIYFEQGYKCRTKLPLDALQILLCGEVK